MADTKPAPLDPVEAHRVLHALLADRDSVVLSQHVRRRSHDRQFDVFDLRHALEHGCVCADSWDDRYQTWKYKVTGVDLDGVQLTVIVVLQSAQGVITVVTAY